jgi:transposase-like protein
MTRTPDGSDRQLERKMPGGRWPTAVRAEAIGLAQTEGLSAAEVARRLGVPQKTIGAWLRSAHRDSDDATDLRAGIVRLANRELARLASSPAGKADLRRLEALARILKTTETDRPNRQQARGLARLAQMAETNGSDDATSGSFDVEASASREP